MQGAHLAGNGKFRRRFRQKITAALDAAQTGDIRVKNGENIQGTIRFGMTSPSFFSWSPPWSAEFFTCKDLTIAFQSSKIESASSLDSRGGSSKGLP